jgi:hypothetical protein
MKRESVIVADLMLPLDNHYLSMYAEPNVEAGYNLDTKRKS